MMIELTIFEYVLNDEDKKKMMDVSSFMIIFRKCQRHNDFPFCRGKGTDNRSIVSIVYNLYSSYNKFLSYVLG